MSSPDQNRLSRMAQFKNVSKSADNRRRREEEGVQLRKEKRTEAIAKRRNITLASVTSSDGEGHNPPAASPRLAKNEAIIAQEVITDLRAGDDGPALAAMSFIRQALSADVMKSVQRASAFVISQGLVPDIVRMLSRTDLPEMQFEAAWALTNIASGSHEDTAVVVRHNGINALVDLLKVQSAPKVLEQAIWALGNIAGDCPEYRDVILARGVVIPLAKIVEHSPTASIRKNAVWTLSNLNRTKAPPPPLHLVAPCIPVLAKVLNNSTDFETIADCCWAFSYMSDGTNDRIETIIAAGVVPRLVELLKVKEDVVVAASLRALGNIVTGDDSQTQVALDAGILPALKNLLNSSSKDQIVKEACWTLSNIAAGSREQIAAMVESGVFVNVIKVTETGSHKARKEAIWTLTNATSGGSAASVQELVELGALDALSEALGTEDAKALHVALAGIENCLRMGEQLKTMDAGFEGQNPVAVALEENQGLDKIEALQKHKNQDIYDKSFAIIDKFFGDVDYEDMAPETNGNEFLFDGPEDPAPNHYHM